MFSELLWILGSSVFQRVKARQVGVSNSSQGVGSCPAIIETFLAFQGFNAQTLSRE